MADEFFAWLTNLVNEYCPVHEIEPLEIVDAEPSESGFYALGWCGECSGYYQILLEVTKVWRLKPEEV
ncbi:hypothetical protein [Geoglobus ahangari]